MSYIIPKSELTLTDMKEYRNRALEAGIARAVKLAVVARPQELVARGAQNILDFGTPLEQWNTAALAAIGTAYSIFQNQPNPTLARTRLCVFYKVIIETTPIPVCRLTFRYGTLTGNVIAEFDLEQLVNLQEVEGYFSQPVVIDPQQQFAAQVTARIATGVLARVVLGNFLLEPIGLTIA